MRVAKALCLIGVLVGSACSKSDDNTDDASVVWDCLHDADAESPKYLNQLGCPTDFDALASAPLDASIPGARSVKTVLDRVDGDAQYFQNSELYPIHWMFTSENLSGSGLPVVPELSVFNGTEYSSPDRRFLLGAVTYYQGPGVWAHELAPYDTASAEMITAAYRSIASNVWFGDDLYFHPTSTAIADRTADLPDDVKVITTAELFAGITYQPLNLGVSMGRLAFYTNVELNTVVPDFREIVVIDAVPNDISVVAGLITDAFQTPLSHVNVLSQNRGTPNMALIGAFSDAELLALNGKFVELTVTADDWQVVEVTQAQADAWWEANKPDPIDVTPMDTSVTALTDVRDILDLESSALSGAINDKVPIFGGKATHFGGLALLEEVRSPPGFAIPVYWYDKFMTDNGLWAVVDEMLTDPTFLGDVNVRKQRLEELRDTIKATELSASFVATVEAELNTRFPDLRCRFRSSTNAEDVNGFNGAGLYTSKSGQPGNPDYPVDEAILKVYASTWSLRAYEERSYYSIEHRNIGMAMLVHPSFTNEEANGVAITANIFDRTGLDPAFYVNVQVGEASVVAPNFGVTTDQFLYYYTQSGQPVVYLASSSLVPAGQTVLTNAQIHELGLGMEAIHNFFYNAYGTDGGFYGMDIEFKLDDLPEGGQGVYIKQARSYPGWGF